MHRSGMAFHRQVINAGGADQEGGKGVVVSFVGDYPDIRLVGMKHGSYFFRNFRQQRNVFLCDHDVAHSSIQGHIYQRIAQPPRQVAVGGRKQVIKMG